jgi:hypothetical protein
MTAEVAILNKWAVALSADSAVTTGQPGQEKIFNGANKIFTLSKYAPVGIMIYGHVEHFGIHWEVLIKDYRQNLGRKRFSHVSGYVEDFKKYFCSSKITTDYQQVLGVLIACSHTSGSILSAAADHAGLRATAKIIKAVMAVCEEALSSSKVLPAYADYSYQSFCQKYAQILSDYIKNDPFDLIHIPKACGPAFKRLVYHYLISAMNTKYSTGIVIAGFGEEELFPTLFHFGVDGGVAGRVRILDRDPVDIGRAGETVHVEAFAQEDAVEAFMNGVDDDHREYTANIFRGFVVSHTKDILDEHTQLSDAEKMTVAAMVAKNLDESVDKFRDVMRLFSFKNFRLPIEEVLRNAPKDELAHVAESLVNLTSLKRRVSGDPETVGGPVDVAVISKGDGFVWIKRKHYFKSELNHHFTRNYFDQGGEHAHGDQAEV